MKKASALLTFATGSSSVMSMGGEPTGFSCLFLWPRTTGLLGPGSLSLISMYRPLLLDPPACGWLS